MNQGIKVEIKQRRKSKDNGTNGLPRWLSG